MTTYYKVVNNDLCSLVVIDPRLRIQYKLGEFVSSLYNLPLAFCSSLENAEKWAESWQGRIFECEIKGKMKKRWLPSCNIFNQWGHASPIIDRMIKKKKYSHLICRELPLFTETCKHIKLVKEIK